MIIQYSEKGFVQKSWNEPKTKLNSYNSLFAAVTYQKNAEKSATTVAPSQKVTENQTLLVS